MGTACWEMARVMAGRPAVGSELTDDYTALDAGLYGAVSLQKGCYVGQETLAKVRQGGRGALRCAGDGGLASKPWRAAVQACPQHPNCCTCLLSSLPQCDGAVLIAPHLPASPLCNALPVQSTHVQSGVTRPRPRCHLQVHNLDAVRQQLWGLEMEAPCVVGDPVLAADGRQLGAITSYIDTPSGACREWVWLDVRLQLLRMRMACGDAHTACLSCTEQQQFGLNASTLLHHPEPRRAFPLRLATRAGQHRALAYLKCRVEGRQVDLEGTAVSAGGSRGRVVLPPFLSRGFPAGEQEAAAPAAAPAPAAQDDAEAAARRAQKLAEMQARLAAYQATAQQQQQQQQGTE